jgi:two-component system, cell cycle sensor histidine kinase and response regulator CckA
MTGLKTTEEIFLQETEKERCRASEEKYRLITEHMRDVVWQTTPDLVITYVTPSVKRLLGYEPQEIVGRHLTDLLTTVGRELVQNRYPEIMSRLAAHQDFDTEVSVVEQIRNDGTTVWTEVITVPAFDSAGQFIGFQGVTRDVSKRVEHEEALRASAEKYRNLVESISDVIFEIDANGVVTYISPVVRNGFGYEVGDFIGKTFLEFVHPEDIDLLMKRFSELTKGVEYPLEYRVVSKSGEVRHVRTYTKPIIKENIFEGARGTLIDITASKRAEENLRQSEDKFNKAFSLNPDAITITRLVDGVFESVNEGFKQLSGYAEEEVIGKTALELNIWVNNEDRNRLIEALKAEGRVDNFQAPFLTKGGDIWYGLLSATIIALNKVEHILLVTKNITERKRMEEERLKMERKLLHAQKLESLGVMAGGIAHDFNNQLAVVLGNLELALTDQTLDPETLLVIESAVGGARRSAELSRQMQVYTGNILYFPVDIDLNELLNRNPGLLQSTVSKYVTLNFETSGALPIIKGDAKQFQRLVMNILVNASEAISDKDGNVTLRTGFMDCDSAYLRRSRLEEKPAPGRFVFLEVSDTGCGMDAQTIRKLFDPFFSTKFTGRGLGMAEVMGTIKGLQGAIIVESEVGKGTTVRLLFPALEKAPASPVQVMDLVETKAPALETVNRRKTILVVEDEVGVRNLVVRRLDLLSYDSIIAEDGEEGVRVFRERMNEIDLVMLDYKMPKMNGVEAFGELIRIKPNVKVILSSGYTEDVVMESFPGQRPACVLHKPYNMTDLKDQLDILLGTEN